MFEVNYKDDSGRWQDSPVYAVDKKNSRFLLVDDNGRFFWTRISECREGRSDYYYDKN